MQIVKRLCAVDRRQDQKQYTTEDTEETEWSTLSKKSFISSGEIEE